MIAFISDIHGNYPALLQVMNEIVSSGITKTYSLGDVCGYYPLINECIDLLIKYNVKNILGNHDNYLINNVDCSRSYTVNLAIQYQKSILTEKNLKWLKTSRDCFNNEIFYAVHGGVDDHLEEYTYTPTFPHGLKQNLFLCGHTHVQQHMKKDEKTFCNPGSVGQPRDLNPRAAYAVLKDNGSIETRRIEYDIPAIVDACKKIGYESRFYSCLYTGEPISSNK